MKTPSQGGVFLCACRHRPAEVGRAEPCSAALPSRRREREQRHLGVGGWDATTRGFGNVQRQTSWCLGLLPTRERCSSHRWEHHAGHRSAYPKMLGTQAGQPRQGAHDFLHDDGRGVQHRATAHTRQHLPVLDWETHRFIARRGRERSMQAWACGLLLASSIVCMWCVHAGCVCVACRLSVQFRDTRCRAGVLRVASRSSHT